MRLPNHNNYTRTKYKHELSYSLLNLLQYNLYYDLTNNVFFILICENENVIYSYCYKVNEANLLYSVHNMKYQKKTVYNIKIVRNIKFRHIQSYNIK